MFREVQNAFIAKWLITDLSQKSVGNSQLRERERERELRELRGFDRERSAHKKALLEILWCDDYQDSLHGVWNSGTT